MALLVSSRLLEVPPNADILAEENFSVLLQPVEHLLDVLLEESQGKSLVEFDLLGVPLGLQLPVVGEYLVYDGEDVAGSLLVVSRGVRGLGRRSRVLK